MKYIAKKFGSLLLTLLLVSFLSFFAFSVIPGDAAKSQLGTEATPERIEALQKEMGLDRPVLERYASWVTGFFHGDLGTSYSYSMPVGELIRDKVPITIAITVIAFLMILVVSIPIGIFTAQHAGGHLDRLIMTINQVIMSVPGFFIGILITYLFGLILKWFQPGAYVPISENFSGFVAHPAQKNLVGGGSGAVPACLLLYDCGHSLPSVCFPAYLSEQAHRCLYFLRTLFSVCVFRSGILFRGVRGRPSGRN